MTANAFQLRFLLLAALGAALGGCTQAVETSNAFAGQGKQAIHDTKEKWSDLLTYRPRSNTPQLPQTRYCYTMQSDIVCYDSLQPGMTASLIGYQDGPSIAWYQPGGGSTGYSGAPATSVYPHGNILPLGGSSADHSESTYQKVVPQGVDEITTTNNMPSNLRKAPK